MSKNIVNYILNLEFVKKVFNNLYFYIPGLNPNTKRNSYKYKIINNNKKRYEISNQLSFNIFKNITYVIKDDSCGIYLISKLHEDNNYHNYENFKEHSYKITDKIVVSNRITYDNKHLYFNNNNVYINNKVNFNQNFSEEDNFNYIFNQSKIQSSPVILEITHDELSINTLTLNLIKNKILGMMDSCINNINNIKLIMKNNNM